MAFISAFPLPSRSYVSFNHPCKSPSSRSPPRLCYASTPRMTATSTHTSTLATPTVFNWYERWYAVTWTADVPKDTAVCITLWKKTYALFRDPRSGEYIAMEDRYGLSSARVTVRKDKTVLCCNDHMFSSNGHCLSSNSGSSVCIFPVHVAIGMVFLWPSHAPPDLSTLPLPQGLLESDITLIQTMRRTFPYSAATLLENVADPAHFPWAHHGIGAANRETVTRDGGLRIVSKDESGVRLDITAGGKVRSIGHWMAPFGVFYETYAGNFAKKLYVLNWVVPKGSGECQLLYAAGGLEVNWAYKVAASMPRWWQHLSVNSVLDGDNVILKKVEEEVGYKWKGRYVLCSGTWDLLVVEIRKWMDKFQMPCDELNKTECDREDINDRFKWHVQDCQSCKKALTVLKIATLMSWVFAAVCLAFVIAASVIWVALGKANFLVIGVSLSTCASLVAIGRKLGEICGRLLYTEEAYEKRRLPQSQ